MGREGREHQTTGAWFTATQWNVVWAAQDKDSPAAVAARDYLCRAYWAPVYTFIRRSGFGPHDAQDLTQEFLSRFFEKSCLDHLTHQDGKFRSFVLTVLKHFLSDQRDRAKALKRGGAHSFVSLDAYETEEQMAVVPHDGLTPDQIYEKRWAQAVMDRALVQLRDEYRARDKGPLFEALNHLQPGKHGEQSYAELGARFEMSEQAVKNAVHSMRRRYSEVLRRVIAETVRDPSQVDAEIRHLMQIMAL